MRVGVALNGLLRLVEPLCKFFFGDSCLVCLLSADLIGGDTAFDRIRVLLSRLFGGKRALLHFLDGFRQDGLLGRVLGGHLQGASLRLSVLVERGLGLADRVLQVGLRLRRVDLNVAEFAP